MTVIYEETTYTEPVRRPAVWIEISDEEILEDLTWPLPPPGRWNVPER